MAVRTPLYFDGSDSLQQLSTDQINLYKNWMWWMYVNNPSAVITAGSGLGTMIDTRYISGEVTTDVTDFDTLAELQDPTIVTANYANWKVTKASPTLTPDNGTKYFVYYNAQGELQAMSYIDMVDTFMPDVRDRIASDEFHYISKSSSVTGFSTRKIFTDTRADITAYSNYNAANLPAGNAGNYINLSQTVNNYYIHTATNGLTQMALVEPSIQPVVSLLPNGNAHPLSIVDLRTILEELVRYVVINEPGYIIDWNLNGTGTTLGTTIINTTYTGVAPGIRKTLRVNTDDYRAVEFPTGSSTTNANTYKLKVQIT